MVRQRLALIQEIPEGPDRLLAAAQWDVLLAVLDQVRAAAQAA